MIDAPPSLFFEPGWDLLLNLYAREAAGMVTTVSVLVEAANLSYATGLRILKNLVEHGAVERWSDPDDRRLVLVTLSAETEAMLTRWLQVFASDVGARDV